MSDVNQPFHYNRFFTKNYQAILRRKNFLQTRVNATSNKVLSFDLSEKRALLYVLGIFDKARDIMNDENVSQQEKEIIKNLLSITEHDSEAYDRIKKRLEAKNNNEQ